MLQGEGLQIACENLWANKLRSLLTLLGIAIGIAATISLLAMGLGFKKSIIKDFSKIGTNLIIVYPNYSENGKKILPLTERDQRMITDVCQTQLGTLLPHLTSYEQAQYRKHTSNCSITGVTEAFQQIEPATLKAGRFLSQADRAVGKKVVMLDWKIAEQLFQNSNPVGKHLRIRNEIFLIIGVLARNTNFSLLRGRGMSIFLPTTTLQKFLKRTDYDVFFLTVKNPNETEAVSAKIAALMQVRYGKDHNFKIENTKEFLKEILNVMNLTTALLGFIGAISLLVGGVGIMNIMLVTVTERLREIGIRKALGAKRKSILGQFLTEAIFICLCGGGLGVFISYLISWYVAWRTPLELPITLSLISFAFFFATLVGLFFGVFPAWKAAKLDPIEALRYE